MSPAGPGEWSEPWRRWYRRALPAYWVFLFCVTHFPKLELPGRVPQSDKLLHVAAFGLLAFLYWRFAEARHRPLSGRFVWIALAVLVLYAALDEWLQGFAGRSADLTDWLANVLGVVLVLAALEWRRRVAARAA
jgi:VanZ family protein